MKVSDIKEGLEQALQANGLWFQWLMMEKMQIQMVLHTPLRDLAEPEILLQMGEYMPAIEAQIVECVNARQLILVKLSQLGIQFPEN